MTTIFDLEELCRRLSREYNNPHLFAAATAFHHGFQKPRDILYLLIQRLAQENAELKMKKGPPPSGRGLSTKLPHSDVTAVLIQLPGRSG